MRWPTHARPLDLAVALLGLVVLTLGCTAAAQPWQSVAAPWVASAFVLGLLARIADS